MSLLRCDVAIGPDCWDEEEGKTVHFPVNLSSNPQLWPLSFGVEQKNATADIRPLLFPLH